LLLYAAATSEAVLTFLMQMATNLSMDHTDLGRHTNTRIEGTGKPFGVESIARGLTQALRQTQQQGHNSSRFKKILCRL